jgi:hypothetical protein
MPSQDGGLLDDIFIPQNIHGSRELQIPPDKE